MNNGGQYMKNHTGPIKKNQLPKIVDTLTEENQRYILGVLQALNFAQNSTDTNGQKTACSCVKQHGN
jgi:hypothetical protein